MEHYHGHQKKKVLIVEDEEPMRRMLSDAFGSANFEVLEACDGEEGLSGALKNHPDVILLDIVMPKMDGLTMLQKLRENDWGKGVPVLLLTNFGDTEKIVEATRGGASGYLVKSNWEVEEIVQKVREILP